ncbi:hypothetical protein P692DRAFT_20883098 [Suillus brevipes Sb2]|nr:hypothetical protein P692DRAFT_20883098 [Suillus brevipes Sb2]
MSLSCSPKSLTSKQLEPPMARKKSALSVPLPAPPDDGRPIKDFTQHQDGLHVHDMHQKNSRCLVFFSTFPPSLLMSHLVDQDAQGKEARKVAKYATQALRGRQVLEELNDFARLDPESEEEDETSSNELGNGQPVSFQFHSVPINSKSHSRNVTVPTAVQTPMPHAKQENYHGPLKLTARAHHIPYAMPKSAVTSH